MKRPLDQSSGIVSIHLGRDLSRVVDSLAAERGSSRSALVKRALVEHLEAAGHDRAELRRVVTKAATDRVLASIFATPSAA